MHSLELCAFRRFLFYDKKLENLLSVSFARHVRLCHLYYRHLQ